MSEFGDEVLTEGTARRGLAEFLSHVQVSRAGGRGSRSWDFSKVHVLTKS